MAGIGLTYEHWFDYEITDNLDYYLLGKGRNDGDFVRHMDDLDDQPNPEGDDTGGPAGGQREFLSWLAGRPPKAGNAALNQPITKWDVLGQPDGQGTRQEVQVVAVLLECISISILRGLKSTAQIDLQHAWTARSSR